MTKNTTSLVKTNPATARLLLALDIVAQIATNPLFDIRHGSEIRGELSDFMGELPKDTPAKAVVSANLTKKHCSVCAKGAVAIAHVLRFNTLTTGNLRASQIQNVDQLPEFPGRMMDEIEALFEGRVYGGVASYSDSLEEDELHQIKKWRVDNFGGEYGDRLDYGTSKLTPAQKLTKIMALCIANSGTHFLLPPPGTVKTGPKRDYRGRFSR